MEKATEKGGSTYRERVTKNEVQPTRRGQLKEGSTYNDMEVGLHFLSEPSLFGSSSTQCNTLHAPGQRFFSLSNIIEVGGDQEKEGRTYQAPQTTDDYAIVIIEHAALPWRHYSWKAFLSGLVLQLFILLETFQPSARRKAM
ncbi:hypothetical protein H5410_001600 [Solanum commersonii]|uniref:Uncharacterized protein n=1 Tax=Solanum commersonii TaxID=4109 RepID=A0A9J6B040_SOLCO|nr:hypothetical protein H5410_001600 [Solanum commersonii]